ncbi:DUF6153 family protein [Streptomyces sp. NPDC003327]
MLRATLLAVVLVLFGMHVLASRHPIHSSHATAVPLAGAHGTTEHKHSHAAPADAAATPRSPDGECDHGGAGEGCLALLYMVAALFTFALRRQAGNGVLRRWAARARPRAGRTGDPPCLHRLSILRC